MENIKVYVKNEAESKEVQDLLFELGGDFYFGGKLQCNTHLSLVTINKNGLMANIELEGFEYKEITLQYLRDLVVLKRNDRKDTTHYRSDGKEYFHAKSTDYFYHFQDDAWVLSTWMNYQLLPQLKPIEKEVKMKEFLNPEQEYALVKCFVGETPIPESWIEVPEGAEIFLLDKSCGEDVFYFVKRDSEVFHEYYVSGTNISHNTWIKGTIKELHNYMGKVLWQRNALTTLDSKNTSTQDKLKFIEKWLNGEKIQYILGIETDKSKWHNFTEGAMQYIKRSDIKFREAPKYVTINGIEFKSVKSLLKHVKNNFDLED